MMFCKMCYNVYKFVLTEGGHMKYNYPKALKRLRAKLDLSQEDLAKLLNVSFMSVNRWENGKHEPTIIIKEKLNYLFEENNVTLEKEGE